jgi:beta-lactam-binding protein with PASTA domain
VASSQPANRVIDIVPQSGTALRQGATVNVLVSTGQREPARVPNLIGLPLGDVTDALNAFREENDVQVEWTAEYVAISDSGLWNLVVATDPAPGSIITNGASIRVIVGQKPGG